MSDYLGHLLERSFTPTPEVKPRVPSLFEPKPAGENTGRQLDVIEKPQPMVDGNNGRAPSVDPGSEPTPGASKPAAIGEFAPMQKRPGNNGSAAPKVSAPADFVEPEEKREIRPTAASSERPRISNDQPKPAASAQIQFPLRNETPRRVPVHARLTEHRDNRIPSPVVVDFHIDDPQRRSGDRRPPASSELPQRLQPRAQPIAPDDLKPTRALVPRHPPAATTSPSREKAAPRDDSNAPAAPTLPPSINVTIGRVEIRATPPPTPTVRHAPRKESGMSLENYLQRRSGGSS